MGKEWIKVKEIGQLYLEKILVSFEVPILFVCTDYEQRKYLCLNTDDEEGRNVIVLTTSRYLVNMMKNKITMESVFRNAVDGKAIVAWYDFKNNKIASSVEDAAKIDADLLPQKNAFLEFSNKEINDYIENLEKQLINLEIESFCSLKTYKLKKSLSLVGMDILTLIDHNREKILISETSKKCSYRISNNKMIA